MGEANPEARARIALLTGHEPQCWMEPDGQQFLRIGDVVVAAIGCALWSDPSVFERQNSISISWGGNRFDMPITRQAPTESD